MKYSSAQAQAILARAELLVTPAEVRVAVARVADEIAVVLCEQQPLLLAVMRGGIVFAGRLLPLLQFPLDFDYIDATRYGENMRGGELHWRMDVPAAARGRVVLLIDDILDEGRTLAAMRDRLLEQGALRVLIAVFAELRCAVGDRG